jgi:hypothetical protein
MEIVQLDHAILETSVIVENALQCILCLAEPLVLLQDNALLISFAPPTELVLMPILNSLNALKILTALNQIQFANVLPSPKSSIVPRLFLTHVPKKNQIFQAAWPQATAQLPPTLQTRAVITNAIPIIKRLCLALVPTIVICMETANTILSVEVSQCGQLFSLLSSQLFSSWLLSYLSSS